MKRVLLILLMVCLAILATQFVSCKKDNSKDQIEGRNRKGRPTNELVVSMGAMIPHEFEPRNRYGMYNEAHITHSTLLRRTADLEIVGDLAKSYTISPDGLIWTFDIHDHFKFSNGEPVTANDVKFTYEMLIEDGRHWSLDFVSRIEIPENNRIVFILNEPCSTFASSQLVEVPIVPEAYYDDNYKFNPIGSGPYMVAEYQPGEQAIFVVNPYWHGEEPYFKKWTWVLLDENAAIAALQSGDVDVVYASPELADKPIKGCTLFDIPANDVRGLSLPYVREGVITDSPDGYKVGNNITSDPILRRAMNIGVDRQRVVDVALNGHGRPAYSVIDNMPFWNPEAVIKDNDVQEAMRVLDEGGWLVGPDGIRVKDGERAEFDLYYATSDLLRTNVAIEAANQLKKLGIKANLVGSNWDEMMKKSHEVALLYAGGRHNPNPFFISHHPSTAGRGWTNVTFYNNPKVTEYIEKAMSSADLDESIRYWKLAQWDGETGCSVRGDLPYLWLVSINHTYVGDSRIDVGNQGIHSHGHDWSLIANIAEWTWKGDK